MFYERPAEYIVPSHKTVVDRSCPKCGKGPVMAYPVISEGGWFKTIRCQACLYQLEREPWRLHGPIEFLGDDMEAL